MTEAQIQPAANSGPATALGVLALITAIIAFLVPILGVLWFNPIASILGVLALRSEPASWRLPFSSSPSSRWS